MAESKHLDDLKRPMRRVDVHELGKPSVDRVSVWAAEELGPGGAPASYVLSVGEPYDTRHRSVPLEFQNGPVGDFPNGVTNEALLAVVIDRLEKFQAGPHPCHENGKAVNAIREGLAWLKDRTADRLARGVEGQNVT